MDSNPNCNTNCCCVRMIAYIRHYSTGFHWEDGNSSGNSVSPADGLQPKHTEDSSLSLFWFNFSPRHCWITNSHWPHPHLCWQWRCQTDLTSQDGWIRYPLSNQPRRRITLTASPAQNWDLRISLSSSKLVRPWDCSKSGCLKLEHKRERSAHVVPYSKTSLYKLNNSISSP